MALVTSRTVTRELLAGSLFAYCARSHLSRGGASTRAEEHLGWSCTLGDNLWVVWKACCSPVLADA